MKLDEIIVEKDQRTDELLGGIARGAGKVLGGVAKGVGAVAGIGQGMKKAFQKGKQASIDVIGGKDQPNTKAAPQPSQGSGGNNTTGDSGGDAGGGGGIVAAFQRGVNNPMGGGKAQPQQAQGGAAQTPQPQTQQAQGDAAPEEPKAEPGVVQDLQKRITALDKDSQREVLQLLQKSAKAPEAEPKPEPAADTTAPPAPAAAPATKPPAQIVGKGGSKFDQQTGKPFTSQADADAQDDEREAYAKAQQEPEAKPAATTQPAATEKPAPAAGNTAQQDLKAKLKAGGGLAKTSGSGFKQGMAKGNMRLGAGRGGVSMSHVPDGNPLIESKKFSLFRKQR